MGLSETQAQEAMLKFKFRKYKKNEFLIKPGQTAGRIYFVQSGSLILGSEATDTPVTRHLAMAGEFITCLESFSIQRPTADFLKAAETTTVYHLDKSNFDFFRNHIPAIETYYQNLVFSTLVKCQNRITALISLDAKAYYENILLENPGYVTKMAQYELASYMGIQPQSLSRIRASTRKK